MELWSPEQLQVNKPRDCRPPAGFRGARGITSVREVRGHVASSNGSPARKPTAAIAEGLRYEAKAHIHLKKLFGSLGSYRSGVPLGFTTRSRKFRVCVPDALVRGPFAPHPLIIEIKLSHTLQAWYQLRKLYQPVVREWLQQPCIVLEVCKNFDPSTSFPEEVLLVKDPREFWQVGASVFGVYVWKG